MKKISIIGLGYVGLPTFLILSNLKKNNSFLYKVEGVEKNDHRGNQIKKFFEKKKKWIHSEDPNYHNLFNKACSRKDIKINTNLNNLSKSKVIIVSIGFEFTKKENSFENLKKLVAEIANRIDKKTLVMFESTLPPGTTDKVIIPIFKKILEKRKIKLEDIFLCYSYERVTPGFNYIDSIISSFRCYSGINKYSKEKCKNFLKTFINYKKFKLTEFNKIIECETSKVLENSYRASNIAFIDEWTKASKIIKVDLNKIVAAIRLRDTHSNIMWPGLGVGGYCLTKDPSFMDFSIRNFFKQKNKFPMVAQSLQINKKMTQTSENFIYSIVKNINKKKILICGLSYKEDVADLRFSPSLNLIAALKKRGAIISAFDPYYLSGKNIISDQFKLIDSFNENFDTIIFCVAHKKFKSIIFKKKINTKIFDLNRVLSLKQIKTLKTNRYFKLGSYS